MLSLPIHVFIGHCQNSTQVKTTHWTDKNGSLLQRDYLQGSEFGHMVETCHRQSSDVVIVESAVKLRRSLLTICVAFTTLLKKA